MRGDSRQRALACDKVVAGSYAHEVVGVL